MSEVAAPTTQLRRDILNGEFAPGDRLVELVLTERYNVGREAIRTALEELEQENLVEHTASRCAIVCDIDINEVIQISEVRSVIESLQAGHAAHHCDDSARAELNQLEQQMTRAVDIADAEAYGDLNREFHVAIRRLSNHRVSSSLLATLECRSDNHTYRLPHQVQGMEASLREHRVIIDAISVNDVDAAADAMTTHLGAALDRLLASHDVGAE